MTRPTEPAQLYDRTSAYDPQDPRARRALALAIQETLTKGGLKRDLKGARGDNEEEVWIRPANERITLVVFTSIVSPGVVREKGTDAIRVVLFYRRQRDGQRRTLADAKRVFRTGTVETIVERLKARCVEVWEAGKKPPLCPSCGAPLVTAKKTGKLVCVEACFDGRLEGGDR